VIGSRVAINVRARNPMASGGNIVKGSAMRHGIKVGFAVVLLVACNKGGGSPGASEGGGEESSGGGDVAVPNSAVHKSGSGSVSALIGPPGGSLELASGAKVEIPPGSLQGGEEFVLKDAPNTTAFFNSEHERPVGPTFIFSPDVQAPEGRTIRVSIPLGSAPQGWGEPSIAFEYPVGEMVGAEDAEHTKWQYEDAKLSGGRVVAELPALNGYRLQFVLTNLEAQ
jgi:hypothetical protein